MNARAQATTTYQGIDAPIDPLDLLTRKEAARVLKVSVSTIDRKLANGEIRYTTIGRGTHAPVRIPRGWLTEDLGLAVATAPKRPSASARAALARHRARWCDQ